MAYSTWCKRPWGLHVITSVSYCSPQNGVSKLYSGSWCHTVQTNFARSVRYVVLHIGLWVLPQVQLAPAHRTSGDLWHGSNTGSVLGFNHLRDQYNMLSLSWAINIDGRKPWQTQLLRHSHACPCIRNVLSNFISRPGRQVWGADQMADILESSACHCLQQSRLPDYETWGLQSATPNLPPFRQLGEIFWCVCYRLVAQCWRWDGSQ